MNIVTCSIWVAVSYIIKNFYSSSGKKLYQIIQIFYNKNMYSKIMEVNWKIIDFYLNSISSA